MTDVYITLPKPQTNEGSSFTATAYFRSGDAEDTPTVAKYRVDCLTTGKKLTDWTSLTPSVSNSITMTATHNAMQDENNTRERKQITVAANPDTSTAVINTAYWDVINNQAY
jgi:choline dehydrogenase-like flavoprotein